MKIKKKMNFDTILPHLRALLALLEFFLITKHIFREKKKTPKKLPFVAVTGAAVSPPVSGTHPQPCTSVKSSSEICVGLWD